uniref:TPR_REGION domain-containing protein n=1 Tax=Schistocephalus solidus TaxID=70667 RepID=A0A183SU96_SCHSO
LNGTSWSEEELWRLRQRDAWLPSEATRRALLLLTSSSSTASRTPDETVSDSSAFTLPGLMAGEIGQGSGLGGGASLGATEHLGTGDPYRSLLASCYSSEAKADSVRRIVTADDVPQDVSGLRQLLAGNWYRSALDLTHRLLTSCGHGLGKTGQPSARITPYSAQLWLLRFGLLKQTKQYELMEREFAAFSNLDSPDLYFEYFPTLYPNRKGSIIPFSLRLLYAELPRLLDRKSEALDRLYYLSAVVCRLISNLENGYTEDGTVACPSDEYKESSLRLWRRRECRILACCLSIYLSDHEYPSAIDTAELMIEQLRNLNEHQPVYALLGRIYLRFGDLESAQRCFSMALDGLDPNEDYTRSQKRTFEAQILIGQGKFDEAKKLFRGVLENSPSNVTAANNLAVCSLYLGQLEEAISVLEALTTPADPVCGRPILHDVIVANLAVLYEVESDGSAARKLRLLERLAAAPGETVSVSAIKLG